jgi:hypothetical protein
MSERAFCSRRVTTTSDCQRAMREQQGTGTLRLRRARERAQMTLTTHQGIESHTLG